MMCSCSVSGFAYQVSLFERGGWGKAASIMACVLVLNRKLAMTGHGVDVDL